MKMDSKCVFCKNKLPTSGDYVTCYNCQSGMHFQCSTIKESTYKAKGEKARREWKCSLCRKQRDHSTESTRSVKSTESEIPKSADNSDLMFAQMREIKSVLKNMQHQLEEQNKSQHFINDQYEELKKEQTDLMKHIKNLENKINNLQQENVKKDSIITVLNKRIFDLEQNSLENHIDITGTPYIEKNKPEEVAVKIFESVGVKIKTTDILSCESIVKNKGTQKSHLIRAKLANKQLSSEIIKNKNKTTLNKNIFGQEYNGRIKIYESLTSETKKLLWETKNKALNAKWKYVWIKNQKILARKEDNSPVVAISFETDLEKIN